MARIGRGHPSRPIVGRAPLAGPAQGTIAVAFALTATGTKHASGSATITVALDFSTTGTKHTGMNLPARRRPWQFVLGPASGGHQLALTRAKGRRYTAKLTEPSETAFQINGRHTQAAAIEELSTDIHVLWRSPGGTTHELDRLRVGPTQDTLDPTSHSMGVTALDYRAVLVRRRLFAGAALTYTGVDQGEIAWNLIAYTQGLTGGNLGISKRWTGTTPTGVNRDRTYTEGDSIGERITELSEVTDGFDWDITPDGASALTLDVWHPQRGVDRGVILIHGGLVTHAKREVNPSEYANAIRQSGDDALLAMERTAPDLATRPEGRWDAQYGDTGITTLQALSDRADWQIEQSQVINPVWTITLRRGAWDGPDHIWLGDPVRLIVKSGRLNVDTQIRVHELSFPIDDKGTDAPVELTLGGPKPDYRRRPRATQQRLTTLERR